MKVVFIQGGGVGADQEAAVRKIIAAAGIEIDWQLHLAGQAAVDAGQPARCRPFSTRCGRPKSRLKTKLLHPPGPVVELESEVSARPRALRVRASAAESAGVPSRFTGLDILLIREITEDFTPPSSMRSCRAWCRASRSLPRPLARFFHFAFHLAEERNRRTIHCIHKANILKMADGLFLDCFRRVADRLPEDSG